VIVRSNEKKEKIVGYSSGGILSSGKTMVDHRQTPRSRGRERKKKEALRQGAATTNQVQAVWLRKIGEGKGGNRHWMDRE